VGEWVVTAIEVTAHCEPPTTNPLSPRHPLDNVRPFPPFPHNPSTQARAQ